MLDLPGEVDAQLVRELHLAQRILEQLELDAVVPGPWELMLIEDSELHSFPPAMARESTRQLASREGFSSDISMTSGH